MRILHKLELKRAINNLKALAGAKTWQIFGKFYWEVLSITIFQYKSTLPIE